jgi:acyl-coenzyme A thioesterase 9
MLICAGAVCSERPRLDMLAEATPVCDIRLSGQVIAVGRSSMEVAVKMEALDAHAARGARTLLLGRFSMVCRDARTHAARAVNPLLVITQAERALAESGAAHRAGRHALALAALSRAPPTSAEARALHAFQLAYGAEAPTHTRLQPGEERVWMGDTRLEVCQLMMPQERKWVHAKCVGKEVLTRL